MQETNEVQRTPSAPGRLGKVYALLLIMVVIFGIAVPVIKRSLREMSPIAFSASRYLIASVLLTLLLLVTEKRFWVRRQDTLRVIGLGLLGHGLAQVLLVAGMARASANDTAVILASTPVAAGLLATLMRVEHPGRRGKLGIAASFLGMVPIALSDRAGLGHGDLVGDLLVLAGVVCTAAYLVLIRPLMQENSPLRLTAATITTGAVALLLLTLLGGERVAWAAVSTTAWLCLAYAAILSLALAQVIWSIGVKEAGSTRAAIANNLTPVVTFIVSWSLLGESLTVAQIIGGAITVGGVVLADTDRGLT